MARQAIAANNLTGPYPTAKVNKTWTACDATNKEKTLSTGKEIFNFRNTGASTRVCTITSVATQSTANRTGDLTFTLAALGSPGDEVNVGPLPQEGWMQSDGYIYSEAAHAEVFINVQKLLY